MPLTPEQRARENIDSQLEACGLGHSGLEPDERVCVLGCGGPRVPTARHSLVVDYLLYVDPNAVGVVAAKPEGFSLIGVEIQSAKYSVGLPANVPD